ncbi:unnamed protein product [Brugia timori]|uniref:Transcription initiation factor TFIID subunit 12 n=1 Tax=Brugia timori TaxID=42155 RepID=A0A158PT52_9BILA|nr:unnamed protein product [Brugia timori]
MFFDNEVMRQNLSFQMNIFSPFVPMTLKRKSNVLQLSSCFRVSVYFLTAMKIRYALIALLFYLDPNKLKEAIAEPSQLNVARKLNVIDIIKSVGASEQPHLVAASGSTSILGSLQLDDLIRQIDPTSILDDPVKTMLIEFVDDFVNQVIERSCKLARHRGSDALEATDVDFILRRYYNYPTLLKSEPQAKSDSVENIEKSAEMMAHNQRMALIKKTLKKP